VPVPASPRSYSVPSIARAIRERPLLRDPGFLKYWVSQTPYGFGGPIAGLAIPLIAVDALGAGPIEMGILGAAGTLAFLVVGLPAGVIVDRVRRLPLMLRLNVAGHVILATIPLAAAAGALRMELPYAVQLLLGCVGVVWQVASQAFLPALVGRPRPVEANARMQRATPWGTSRGPASAASSSSSSPRRWRSS